MRLYPPPTSPATGRRERPIVCLNLYTGHRWDPEGGVGVGFPQWCQRCNAQRPLGGIGPVPVTSRRAERREEPTTPLQRMIAEHKRRIGWSR